MPKPLKQNLLERSVISMLLKLLRVRPHCRLTSCLILKDHVYSGEDFTGICMFSIRAGKEGADLKQISKHPHELEIIILRMF
jgi:hypothetical protein